MATASHPPTRVRSYCPGDEMPIIELLEDVFEGWPSFDLDCESIDHWRWRYLESPANSRHLFVCEASGQIVGCLHHSPVTMQIGGQDYPAELGGDIAIQKQFRDRGLVAEFAKSAMHQRNLAGMWFTYFETANPKLIRTYKKSAYQLPIHSRHLLRVHDAARHLSRQGHSHHWFKSVVFKALGVFNRLQHFLRRERTSSDLKLSRITSFDDRFDTFWERLSPHYRLIVRRDREFLNWRYADTRAGNFCVICAEDEDQLVGYIVLRVNRQDVDYPIGYVADLLCEPGREDVAHSMLANSLDYFDQHSVNAVHCLVPQLHPYRKIFGAHGFLDTRERRIVFLRANKPMEQQMAALERIAPGEVYYTYGDIDTI
jgi:hypothetical protein